MLRSNFTIAHSLFVKIKAINLILMLMERLFQGTQTQRHGLRGRTLLFCRKLRGLKEKSSGMS